MFAVIMTGGKQYRVQEGDILPVEKLDAEAGKKVDFDQVLLIEDGENLLVGTPFLENAVVRGEVIENFKDKKILVFKKKRRKQYKRTKGHRQELSRVKIERIIPDRSSAPAEEVVRAERVEEKVAAEARPKKEVKPRARKESIKAGVEGKKPLDKAAREKARGKKRTAAKTSAESKKPGKVKK